MMRLTAALGIFATSALASEDCSFAVGGNNIMTAGNQTTKCCSDQKSLVAGIIMGDATYKAAFSNFIPGCIAPACKCDGKTPTDYHMLVAMTSLCASWSNSTTGGTCYASINHGLNATQSAYQTGGGSLNTALMGATNYTALCLVKLPPIQAAAAAAAIAAAGTNETATEAPCPVTTPEGPVPTTTGAPEKQASTGTVTEKDTNTGAGGNSNTGADGNSNTGADGNSNTGANGNNDANQNTTATNAPAEEVVIKAKIDLVMTIPANKTADQLLADDKFTGTVEAGLKKALGLDNIVGASVEITKIAFGGARILMETTERSLSGSTTLKVEYTVKMPADKSQAVQNTLKSTAFATSAKDDVNAKIAQEPTLQGSYTVTKAEPDTNIEVVGATNNPVSGAMESSALSLLTFSVMLLIQ